MRAQLENVGVLSCFTGENILNMSVIILNPRGRDLSPSKKSRKYSRGFRLFKGGGYY